MRCCNGTATDGWRCHKGAIDMAFNKLLYIRHVSACTSDQKIDKTVSTTANLKHDHPVTVVSGDMPKQLQSIVWLHFARPVYLLPIHLLRYVTIPLHIFSLPSYTNYSDLPSLALRHLPLCKRKAYSGSRGDWIILVLRYALFILLPLTVTLTTACVLIRSSPKQYDNVMNLPVLSVVHPSFLASLS